MLELNPGIENHEVSIPGNGRSALAGAGMLMIGQHSSLPDTLKEICGTGDEGKGLRPINSRTLGEILLENIQLHQELRRLRTSAPHTDGLVSRGDQAASLAHEIKQPIAAAALDARVCMRWLRHDPPDIQQAREAASRVISDTHRAADIVDRVRSLCRMGAFKREPVDVNDVIRDIVPLLHDLSSQNSVSLHTELDPDLPMVSADFVQMQQVLINLMTNGIEAMHDKGGELTVTSRTTEGGEIVVAVSDTGIGLPAAGIDQIFEAFFTTKAEGTGLGLSISRTIVELHGGRLWAGANAGRGATFQFTLPVD